MDAQERMMKEADALGLAVCLGCGLKDSAERFMAEAEGTDEPARCPFCNSHDIIPPGSGDWTDDDPHP